MSESEISAILGAITDMRTEVRGQFDTAFNKIDGVCDRVTVLEGDKIIRDAINSLEEKQTKGRYDWGRWFVRLTMGAIALWAITELLAKFAKG